MATFCGKSLKYEEMEDVRQKIKCGSRNKALRGGTNTNGLISFLYLLERTYIIVEENLPDL
jgi:hypothetical protein